MKSLLDSIKLSLQSNDPNAVKVQYISWGIFAGIVIAVLLLFYYKKIKGSFIRSLIICKAFSPETAQSMTELGQDENYFVIYSLRKGKNLSKIVERTQDKQTGTIKYYISEEHLLKAEKQYADTSTSVWNVITSIIIFAIAAFAAFFAIPILADLISNMI